MRWFWIDRFIEFRRGRRAQAIKNITLVEEAVDDYLPGYPVYPNTLIIEGMAQAGGLLVAEMHGYEKKVVLGKVTKAEFFEPVRPGDQLRYTVVIERWGAEGASVSCTSHCGDQLQAEVELFFAFLDDRFGDQELIPPHDLLTMCRLLRLYEVAQDDEGRPLPIARRLAESEAG
jgi:3-hydroxyacyl-[acyl-carrier-protein] dehydratase